MPGALTEKDQVVPAPRCCCFGIDLTTGHFELALSEGCIKMVARAMLAIEQLNASPICPSHLKVNPSTLGRPCRGGGLVAMGRAWFNLTGGFDEGMHGWGGENLVPRCNCWERFGARAQG